MSEIKKSFPVMLDMKRSASNREFELVEGDTGNEITVTLKDDGQAVDLTGCRVLAVFSKSNGTSSQDSEAGSLIVSGNTVTIPVYAASVAPGLVECELQVYSGENNDTLVTSAKFNFKCRRGILNADTLESTDEYPLLVGLIDDVNGLSEAVNAAEAARASAEAARTLAEAARSSAETARSSAETARSLAEAERCAAEAARISAEEGRQASIAAMREETDAAIAELGEFSLEQLAAAYSHSQQAHDYADAWHTHSSFSHGQESRLEALLLAKQDADMVFTGVTIDPRNWVSDTTYQSLGFTKSCVAACPGIVPSMTVYVEFRPAEQYGGNFAAFCEAVTDGVRLYARQAPESTVTISARAVV